MARSITGKGKKVAKGKSALGPGRPPKTASPISALAAFTLKPPKDHENLSVRKIDNGFVISHDGVKGGKRFEREYYSTKAPTLGGRKPREKQP